jgi:hypothetical protein
MLLRGELGQGQRVRVDFTDGRFDFRTEAGAEAQPPAVH